MKAALLLVLLGASLATAQTLSFQAAPAELRLMGRSDGIRVQRLDAASQPITTGVLSVTVVAPAGAQVSPGPEPFAAWGSSTTVSIANGASLSAPVYLRSGTRGALTWRASANGFTDATALVRVRDDALTCTLESGTTLETEAPPGCFNTLIKPYAQSTILADAQAARRGLFGLRLVDGESANGNAADTALFDDGATTFGDVHARTWVRFTSSNAQGSPLIAQFTNGTGLAPSLIDVKAKSDLTLAVGGFGVDAGYSEAIGDAGFTVGRWHLLEFSLTGSGTADGGRFVFLDGKLMLTQSGLDFSGTSMPVARFAIGEPYADGRRWLGTIDFDDIRSAGVPLASRVSVSVNDAGVGDCASAKVLLRSSFGGVPAFVREETIVHFDAGGQAQLFSDGLCTTPTDRLSLAADASVATFSVRPSASAVTITSSADDFLDGVERFDFALLVDTDAGTPDAGLDAGVPDSGTADAGTPDAGPADAGELDAGTLDAGTPDAGTPDAGTPDAGVDLGPERQLAIGCGCDSGGPGAFLTLLTTLLWCARARKAP